MMRLRQTMILLAAAVATMLTAGCEKPDDTFRVLWRAGRVPEQIIARFGAQTGTKLAVETYSSDEELLAKLSAKGAAYDLIQAEDHIVEALAKDGQLRRLDHAEIPNLKNIAPEFLKLPFDPGAKYSVPFLAGFDGIVYNAETVTIPVVGFADVFHQQHAGRILVSDDAREIASCALLAAGLPVNDMSDDNLAKVTPLLADWLQKVGVYNSTDPKNVLVNGQADIGIVRSDEAARLFAANPKYQWVLPAEGFRMFVSALAIPKTARHRDTAEALMNFLLRPDTGKSISDEFPGYNPNTEARKLLTEAQLDNPASYPTGLDVTKAEMFSDISDRETQVRQLVTSLKLP